MPLPPALGLVANQSALSASLSNTTQAGINVTTGDFILAVLSWWQTSGTQSGTVSVFNDTGGNTWTQIGSTLYSGTDVHAGQIGTAIYYAIAKATVATSWNWTITGISATSPGNIAVRFNVWDFGGNVYSPYIDTTSTQNSGSTTAFSTNGFTPIFGADALLLLGVNNEASTLAAIATPVPLIVASESGGIGTGSNGNLLQYSTFLGEGLSTSTPPYTFSGTLSAAADWLSIVIGVETAGYDFLAQGDTYEASAGYYQPFNFPQTFQFVNASYGFLAQGDTTEASQGYYPQPQQQYFQGYIFAGNYTGLTWLKNIYMLSREYWDSALSTPYSGQLFPVGPGEGGPGQIYPY